MGVDYYTCDNCDKVTNDCLDNVRCEVCDDLICEKCIRDVVKYLISNKHDEDYKETDEEVIRKVYICDNCSEESTTNDIEHQMLCYLIEKYELKWDDVKKEVVGPKSRFQLWKEKYLSDDEDSEDEESENDDNDKGEKEDSDNSEKKTESGQDIINKDINE